MGGRMECGECFLNIAKNFQLLMLSFIKQDGIRIIALQE